MVGVSVVPEVSVHGGELLDVGTNAPLITDPTSLFFTISLFPLILITVRGVPDSMSWYLSPRSIVSRLLFLSLSCLVL